MELNITFGWHLDGPSFPEELGLGHSTMGPIGMLNQLCLRLGLISRYPAQAVRIAEYLSALKAIDDGKNFYSRSLETDSWGTAKALLTLRDELVANGWRPRLTTTAETNVPVRLLAVSSIEKIAGEKVTCLTDMINPILDALETVEKIKIDSITIIDGIALLPPIWQRLFLKLESKGVRIGEWFGCDENCNPISDEVSEQDVELTPAPDPIDKNHSLSDVGKLGAFLNFNQKLEFSGDGSILVLESDDEVQAADYLANLLPLLENGSKKTVVIRGASTSFLDQMLRRHQLPAIGGPRKSPLRGYMQILPLALELLFKPFDPVKLIEFLMVPKGPVPPSIAQNFTLALKREPGIGGKAWEKAWNDTRAHLAKWLVEPPKGSIVPSELGNSHLQTDIEERSNINFKSDIEIQNSKTNLNSDIELQKLNEDIEIQNLKFSLNSDIGEQIQTTVDAREQILREWLECEKFDITGVPAETVIALCQRIKQHANMRLSTSEVEFTSNKNLVFLQTALAAETLATAIESIGTTLITRSQLLRITASVLGEGYSPDNPEASVWTPVDHPGQITTHADTIIWWGFVDGERHGFTNPWSAGESAYLASVGVHLDTPQSAVVREAKSWCRPISVSTKQLLLVKPRTVNGRTVAAHPFYHEVSAAMELTPHETRTKLIKQAHQIYEQSQTECFNKLIKSQLIVPSDLPPQRPVWKVSSNSIEPGVESATSLQRLLGCPMSWVFEHKTKFRFGHLLSMSSGEQLAGNLAHAVFAKVFGNDSLEGKDRSISASLSAARHQSIAEQAKEYFDELCPQMAAPLLLPGNSLERQRLKQAIVEGAEKLSALIDEANFSTIVCEAERNEVIDGISLTGRPDMVLIHPGNSDFVVDLKWTRRAPYRRREITEGRAIQLALYAALQKRQSGIATEGGYYLIAQKQLYSTSAKLFPEHMYVEGLSLQHTFENLIVNFKKHIELIATGSVFATGLHSDSDIGVEIDETGVDIFLDDEPEQLGEKIPGITLTLEPPCRICNFARLCGKKEFQS